MGEVPRVMTRTGVRRHDGLIGTEPRRLELQHPVAIGQLREVRVCDGDGARHDRPLGALIPHLTVAHARLRGHERRVHGDREADLASPSEWVSHEGSCGWKVTAGPSAMGLPGRLLETSAEQPMLPL